MRTWKQRITARLQDLAGQAPDEVEVTSTGGGDTDLERAHKALDQGDRDRAAKLAQKALESATEGTPEHTAAKWTLKRARSSAVLQPNRIAVLLPLFRKGSKNLLATPSSANG